MKPRSAAAKSDRMPDALPAGQVAALVAGQHADPFAVLGVHDGESGFIARCFIPNAETVTAFTLDGREAGELTRRHEDGFFEAPVEVAERQPLRYHARNSGGDWWLTDAYSFGPVLGPMDDYYIGEGSHRRLFDKLGAHLISHEGATGVHFAVWAPNARRVSVVGDFNDWDGRRHVMRLRRGTGIWEIFVPD
ncbi:MAG TPA: 1,4-alpha-glucan branching enzyme, partial [Pararhizobium sp.]|nr:1,4-alpha-glucan branching enzyme [Pararhizobium sp.]